MEPIEAQMNDSDNDPSRDKYNEIIPGDTIPLNSYWLSAAGATYGCKVVETVDDNGDVWIKTFDKEGWTDEPVRDINWFKLQYRYYRVY
jgi:hypothetical protein